MLYAEPPVLSQHGQPRQRSDQRHMRFIHKHFLIEKLLLFDLIALIS
jgi:hypothetical protein